MRKLSLLMIVLLIGAVANAVTVDDFEGVAIGGSVDAANWFSNANATIGGDVPNQYAVLSAVAPIIANPVDVSSNYSILVDTLTPSDGTNSVVTIGLSGAMHSAPILSLIIQNYGAAAGDVSQYAWIAHGGATIWLDNPPALGGNWNSWDIDVTMNAGNTGGTISVSKDGNPLATAAAFTSVASGTPAGSAVFYGTGMIDNVNITPEPMTIALLGLGGLFLRRRK